MSICEKDGQLAAYLLEWDEVLLWHVGLVHTASIATHYYRQFGFGTVWTGDLLMSEMIE